MKLIFKKKIYFGVAALSILMLTSCSDYLDTQPYSFDTVDKLYSSDDGAELGLTGCYNLLNAQSVQGRYWGSFTGGMPMMLGGGTDEAVTRDGFTDEPFAPFGNYTFSSQTSTISNNWFTLYAGINRTNYLIESIDGIEMDEDRQLQMKSEARFLRGLFYFYLSAFYGGVPVYTNTIDQTDDKAPRQSLEVVYDLIISDLEFAHENLEAQNQEGRATKWSAAGYLAKVYTYLASSKKNNVGAELNFPLNSFDWVDADAYYQKALEVTNEIIEESNLELTDNYRYLFLEKTESYKAEESLFTLAAGESEAQGNLNLTLFWRQPVGAAAAGGGYGWLRPLGELYNKYEPIDPRRDHNLTAALDTIKETVDDTNYYIPFELESPNNNYFCIGKYRYRDPDEKSISNSWSDGNIVLLRYADILLLNAEAHYYRGNEPMARQRLDEVLVRAAGTAAVFEVLKPAYEKSDFIEQLLDERSRELCFEGWRRIDLIRFGKLGEAITGLSSDAGAWNIIVPAVQSNWAPHKIWYPIPQNDLELSGLQQNPGY